MVRAAAPILMAVATVAAALSGCATAPAAGVTTRETVVVLPGSNGHVGAVVVRREGQEQLLDKAYAASRIEAEGKLEPVSLTSAQVQQEFRAALAALPPKASSFLLYFLEGKDEFTTESKTEIGRIVEELKRRPAPDIVVIGHTDTVGADSANDRLSLQRAERVRELLIKPLGLGPDRIQSAGRGERELLVPTADGVSEAKNRRVEINVR